MKKFFHVEPKSKHQSDNSKVESDFEYQGYYKFGQILGRGRFGTVIECLRKINNQPIAMKLFKFSGNFFLDFFR